MRLTQSLVVTVTLAVTASAANAQQVTLLNEFNLPSNTVFEGTLVGGLSSLDYDPTTGRYWAISDDRGNDRPNSGPARFYELAIDVDTTGITDVRVTDVVTFLRPDGTPFANGTVDPEGLRRAPDGTFSWSSEGIRQLVNSVDTREDPFIRQTDTSGQFLGEFATPAYYGTTPDDSGVRSNFGFESLSLSADGSQAYTVNENALIQDGPPATFGLKGLTRLGVYDVATGDPIAEYVYLAESPDEMPNPPTQTNFTGNVEILALDEPGTFLVLERSFSVGGAVANTGNHFIQLYLAEIGNATNVLGNDSLTNLVFEPMTKTLFADLNDLLPFLTNVEGLTFGPNLPDGSKTLILAGDNNFGGTVPTQFIALRFDANAVPVPASIGLFGLALIGLMARNRRA